MNKGFFNQHAQSVQTLHRGFDLFLIFLGISIAHKIKFDHAFLLDEKGEWVATLVTLLIVIFVFNFSSLYDARRGKTIISEIGQLLYCGLATGMLLALTAYLTKTGSIFSREWAITSALICFLLLVASRVVIRLTLRALRKSGKNIRNVAIFGANERSQDIAAKLQHEEWTGLKIIGVFDDTAPTESVVSGVPYLGDFGNLLSMIETDPTDNPDNAAIDQVWIVLPFEKSDRIRDVYTQLRNYSVQIHYAPDLGGMDLLSFPLDQFAGIPILNMSAPRIIGPNAAAKTIFDKVLSLAILLIIWPLLLIIAIAIKTGSEGPIIFRQRRYGIDGREIEVWKFRSMTVVEDGDVVDQATANDPRVTGIGRFLRRWSLDELPQFFNVLAGTMSIVGPRPHAVAHNEFYKDKIPMYMSRHLVKPGITGLAQVNGWRGETDELYKMEKRTEFDIRYLRSWSIWLDIQILLKTLWIMLTQKNVY